MRPLADTDWLRAAALAAVGTLLLVILFGANRAFWYDEIYTLGAAQLGPGPDWDALKRDVHPPTYPISVSLVAALTGEVSAWIRVVNLPALLAAIWAGAILWRVLPRERVFILACLILCNLYTLSLAVELRSYIWLLGFGLLGHAALTEEVLEGRSRTAVLIFSATVLTMMHYFGAAIGLSLLAVAALRYLRAGLSRNLLATLVAGAVLFGLFLVWVLGLAETGKALGGSLWIANHIDPWLDFAAWQVPLFALGIGLAIYSRTSHASLEQLSVAGWLLLPAAMVLGFALLVSLHTPVISVRNMIVFVPGVSIALALVLPGGLVEVMRRSPVPLILVVVFALRYGDTSIRAPQMVDWAIRTATPPECAGAPLYFHKPGLVERYAQALFVDGNERPFVELESFAGTGKIPAECPVLAAGWHQLGPRAEIAAFFRAKGVEVDVVPPPDSRLAASEVRTSGYIVLRK